MRLEPNTWYMTRRHELRYCFGKIPPQIETKHVQRWLVMNIHGVIEYYSEDGRWTANRPDDTDLVTRIKDIVDPFPSAVKPAESDQINTGSLPARLPSRIDQIASRLNRCDDQLDGHKKYIDNLLARVNTLEEGAKPTESKAAPPRLITHPAEKLLSEQAVTIGHNGLDVTVLCNTYDDADSFVDWLESYMPSNSSERLSARARQSAIDVLADKGTVVSRNNAIVNVACPN